MSKGMSKGMSKSMNKGMDDRGIERSSDDEGSTARIGKVRLAYDPRRVTRWHRLVLAADLLPQFGSRSGVLLAA